MTQVAWLWPLFIAIFIVSLGLDLFVFQRKAHIISVNEALKLSAFWIGLSLAFAAVVYFTEGAAKGHQFLTAYLLEKSLSIDNLFVFMVLFTYFDVPGQAQRKVLTWGILGAIFFRGIFIFGGTALLSKFHFMTYVLGLFLIYTAVRIFTQKGTEVKPEKNPVVRIAHKLFRVLPGYNGSKFLDRRGGLIYATPLVIVVVAIETTDILFAADSIPAVLGVTLDPFIAYTSNIFAILGLRALFFALAGLFHIFRYIMYALCIILAFIGVKMLIADIYEISTFVSLAVVFTLLTFSIVASILIPEKHRKESPALANPAEKEAVKK